MSSLPKLRIAICGGGIAGLTLACALSRSPDIHIDIYEAASQFAEVGAGIGLWWRPKRVLSAMGLEQDLKALGAKFGDERVTSMTYRKSDQPEGQHVATITSRGTLTTLHRAEFHSTLLRRLSPRVNVHTSKRLVTYTQPPNAHDPIQLRFSDGSVATCDVLVGADGIKSVVRAGVMHEHAVAAEAANRHSEAAAVRECVQPRFGGSVVYRVMIPSEKLARIAPRHRVLRSPYQYIGRNRHLIAYPVSNGHLVNVALFSAKQAQEGSAYPEPWVSQADPCEVLRQFEGWEPEVRQLIQSMDGLAINKWVVNVTQPLPSYCWGRAVLLGDAAHAMTPFQGAGAGSAIEDAFMLANLLASRHATRATMPRVLRLFSQARQPANNRIAALSRSNGLLFSMNNPQVGLSEFARLVQRNWDEGQGGDPLADVRHAVEALESS